MRKKVLSLACACSLLTLGATAQVVHTQDFEGATPPALPTGYTQSSSPSGFETSTAAGTGWGAATGYYNIPTHTKYVVVDDANLSKTANQNDTLESAMFSLLSGMTAPYLNFDCFYYGATKTSSGKKEKAYVLYSNDGGGTWSLADSVAASGTNGAWYRQHVNLTGKLSGSNCKVGFTYTDGGDTILGVALDNIEVKNLIDEAGLVALGYNSPDGVSDNGESVQFLLRNDGKTLSSVEVYYSINGGAPVTQTFTLSPALAPYATTILQFTTPIAGATSGSNTMKMVCTKANGVANPDVDSMLTSTFVKASSKVQRQGLIEEFSSSTCAPCKSFNANYDPLCGTLNANKAGSNFNIIKYQMNWPSPGTDKSYNPHGTSRRTYYSCNSIPDHWVNGFASQVSISPFNATTLTAEATGASSLKSFVDMEATYKIDTVAKKVYVTTKVTPHFTKTGAYHVYIALLDNHYTNSTNTTGQTDYYHVMRTMIPDGGGRAVTSFTDGTAVTSNDSMVYTAKNYYMGSSNYPAQGSFDFWSNPLLGSELVAFIQDDATKTIIQSVLAIPTSKSIVGVSTVTNVTGLSVYPNPAKDEASVDFFLGEAASVSIKVAEYTGRIVSELPNQLMSSGNQHVSVSTANIAPGNYLVMIEANGGVTVQRLTVAK